MYICIVLINQTTNTMKKTVQEFIENYNKCMDWNAELRQRLNSELFSDHHATAEILDDYLSTQKITYENYEIENATIYENAPDHYEMHAHSHVTNRGMYFWTTFGMTKEEYIADRLRVIKKKLSVETASTIELLDSLNLKKEKLEQFTNSINSL